MPIKKKVTQTAVVSHTQGLADTLRRLAADGEQLEGTANHILKVVAETNVRIVATFDELVREAYQQNNWHLRPGRPSAAAQALTSVPPLVRTYVSEVRAAFRLGLKVHSFKTFYELRMAIQKAREQCNGESVRRWPALRGVNLSSPDKLNGALFHDLIVIYDHLDEDTGAALERALVRLVGKYHKEAGALSETEPPEAAAA